LTSAGPGNGEATVLTTRLSGPPYAWHITTCISRSPNLLWISRRLQLDDVELHEGLEPAFCKDTQGKSAAGAARLHGVLILFRSTATILFLVTLSKAAHLIVCGE
jgi:hypothetical protein